ncbi:Phytanoyl-CoA dioxygenase (PhyH) [Thioflavicoccus mobilis 8321]|uniref:Phytanoyl-CoA dioxygenase (PhyH) n=1 Tax=Thioflavicoccus mobilis 8321 TaxID=765912 RepID=L0H2F5_9GAMM|nr:phytanoyl-CoA dioxygenase family protein [Thioflavicoccus mobilis]AGA92232.1 Phytanoyl-CoA dioxygenase (PhyH) [Thioflavicoccus mobilis 8321]
MKGNGELAALLGSARGWGSRESVDPESVRRRFDELGAVVVRDVVPAPALHWAGDAVDRFINEQLAACEPSEGAAVIHHGARRFVIAVNKVGANLGAVPLYLMGLPSVSAAVTAVCGPDAVCTHDWMVVKNGGDGCEVGWHQDFVHDGSHSAVNVGIYLDDAGQDGVRFIPGLRKGAEDVRLLRGRFSYDSPELISPKVSAGDLTLHDVLLVHGSPVLARGRRRTLYLEFRAPEMLTGHSTMTPEYVAARRQLFDTAQRLTLRLGQSPEGDPMALLAESEWRLIEKLDGMQVMVEPANYGNGV